ncbi:LexA family transcriptional regulator [Gimesia aquarii]|uniref:LexA family protein n=1 Tax=Gimesia aquarii TaxID=2527964 RepID=UPI001E5F39D2|nr:LexA family transcriptional regulator [Gimesia aquarii]
MDRRAICLKNLTPKQQQVLSYIGVFIHKHGQAPSVREIGRHFGIKSTNGVCNHLKALERKGRLIRREFMYHSLEVVDNLRMRLGGVVS